MWESRWLPDQKKKTTGWKPDEDKTGIGKWVLSETGWSQIRIVKSGANPYQPGRAVKICWFYQWYKKKKIFPLIWLIKIQSVSYLENCIHVNLIKENQISLIQTLKRKIGRHRFSLWEQTKINNENQKDRITYARVMSERSSNKGTGRMPWH